MTDLSAHQPVVKWSEQWWDNAKPEVRAHRCAAHRKNGDRCKRAAINRGRVCTHHGGNRNVNLNWPRRDALNWPHLPGGSCGLGRVGRR